MTVTVEVFRVSSMTTSPLFDLLSNREQIYKSTGRQPRIEIRDGTRILVLDFASEEEAVLWKLTNL